MKNLTCKKCGGTMVIDASGMTAVCPFCGTKYVLNHEDTDYFNSFYRQMSRFLAGSADDRDRQLRADALWEKAETETFFCVDGSTIEVRYLHRKAFAGGEMLVARKNIIFRFDSETGASEKMRRTVSLIDYPSADTRQLAQFFPRITGGFALESGDTLTVVAKDMDEYPLRLFGHLGGRHVAWIISRMENLCCVLEYNNLVHPLIDPDTLFINPFTHQACLYGGWWNAAKHNTIAPDRRVLTKKDNLIGLRNTAANLLGYPKAGAVRVTDDVPQALADFINGTPMDTAYDDFALWDKMLIRAYGERKFVNLTVDDGGVYGKER